VMPYRGCWRLVGIGERLLDKGELDGLHEHEAGAVEEILMHLPNFAVHGWNAEQKEWWARKTDQADIEMRFRVELRVTTITSTQ
jgi:hypothetical protein